VEAMELARVDAEDLRRLVQLGYPEARLAKLSLRPSDVVAIVRFERGAVVSEVLEARVELVHRRRVCPAIAPREQRGEPRRTGRTARVRTSTGKVHSEAQPTGRSYRSVTMAWWKRLGAAKARSTVARNRGSMKTVGVTSCAFAHAAGRSAARSTTRAWYPVLA